MNLNSAQWEAVRHKDGPVLVLAGPGSGKTTVICERVSYLISEYHIPFHQILVLTYTKAAADSMGQRYQTHHREKIPMLTIHSLCYHFLIEECHFKSISLLSDYAGLQLIQKILVSFGVLREENMEVCSQYKNRMERNELDDIVSRLKKEYEREKAQLGVMDYEDLLIRTYEKLSSDEAVREKWENRYPYVLIDEFQDVNYLQFQIIMLLTKSKKNLMVVGDDDQSIYGFRGAQPQIMQSFLKEYSGAKQILLDKNYRCSKGIMELAGRSISNNKNRIQKTIEAMGDGELAPSVKCYQSVLLQYREIINEILIRKKQGEKLSECAILFRTKEECRKFLLQCAILGIPYQPVNWEMQEFFVIEELVAYVNVILGKWEIKEIIRIMNHPPRGIERIFLSHDVKGTREWMDNLKVAKLETQRIKVEEFQKEIATLRSFSPYLGLSYLFYGIGYEKEAIERIGKGELAKELFDVIKCTVFEVARMSKSWKEFKEQCESMLEKRKKQENRNGIVCMTYHSSKGLEFNRVFLPNLNYGLVPLMKSVRSGLIEEERRLFYVGITRARKELILTYVETESNREKKKSQFLEELGL